MARRRTVRRPDRGWLTTTVATSFSVSDPVTFSDVEPVILYNDIAVDEAGVTGERSDYFLQRMLGWYRLTYFNPNAGIRERLSGFRIGLVEVTDPLDFAASDPVVNMKANGFAFCLEDWARVYHEDVWNTWHADATPFDGTALSVQTAAVTDDTAYMLPGVCHTFDISPKGRLRDDTLVAIQWGPPSLVGLDDNETFGVELYIKCLLQKVRGA